VGKRFELNGAGRESETAREPESRKMTKEKTKSEKREKKLCTVSKFRGL